MITGNGSRETVTSLKCCCWASTQQHSEEMRPGQSDSTARPPLVAGNRHDKWVLSGQLDATSRELRRLLRAAADPRAAASPRAARPGAAAGHRRCGRPTL